MEEHNHSVKAPPLSGSGMSPSQEVTLIFTSAFFPRSYPSSPVSTDAHISIDGPPEQYHSLV